MGFVLDNSVTTCWLLNDGQPSDVAYAREVLGSLTEVQAVVPGIWALEAANVVAKVESKGLLSEAQTQAFVSTLGRLNIVVDKATAAHALGETLNLARRYKLSAYDAAYLELAMREDLHMATVDSTLEKAARKAGVPRFEAKSAS